MALHVALISNGAPGTVDKSVNVKVVGPTEPDTRTVLRRRLIVVVSARDTTAGRLTIAVTHNDDMLREERLYVDRMNG